MNAAVAATLASIPVFAPTPWVVMSVTAHQDTLIWRVLAKMLTNVLWIWTTATRTPRVTTRREASRVHANSDSTEMESNVSTGMSAQTATVAARTGASTFQGGTAACVPAGWNWTQPEKRAEISTNAVC